MSHVTPAAPPPRHSFYRRTSSVLDRAIHGRRSFRAIWARASSLDLGHGDASSAQSIACYFLRMQQDSLDAHLREQQHLQRIGLRKLMNLLQLSSRCSWKASLLCGSLYKSILDASLSIARVQSILEAPSAHSQVGDLLLSLSDLQDLFSEQTLKEIEDAKALFSELDGKIKKYQHRLRVQALSRMRALNRRARHGMLRCRLAMREATAFLLWRFTACTTGMINSDGQEKLLTDGEIAPDGDDDDDDYLDAATENGAIAHYHPALPRESEHPKISAFTGLTPLQKAHVQLHKLQMYMHAVNIMFDTLQSMVKGTHNQTVNQRYVESLRNEPLMFYGVVELISGCHAGLTKHLDDLREELLICFCFINNARDLVYTM